MSGEKEQKNDTEMRSRLDALKAAIDKSQVAEKVSVNTRQVEGDKGLKGIAAGLRVMSEMVAGVLVGAAIGYGIDSYFGTKPWFLLAFLLLGTAAGFRNVYRLGMAPTASTKSDQK
jgi:ATP synthase protein I